MRRVVSFLIIIILFASQSIAKEGMWVPSLLNKFVTKDMRQMGMRLTADEIYSINHSSLKDAVAIFGGGCTAELVSDQGLLLTNHHCGYSTIQSHSTVENDYLTNGFWAGNKEEELANPGLEVTFLVRIEDVTDEVLKGVEKNMSEKERKALVKKHIDTLENEAVKDTRYKAVTKPFYYGNEYYMFIYEDYKDVRLVGAPPSSIGKFGRDTDNWMWPRHTGDFSVFRVYADENNEPAEYSEDNVPYKPKQHMKISLSGYEKGDFTFVFGYPGSTQQFLPASAIKMKTEKIFPARIDLRTQVLDIMKKYMENDDKIKLQYAAKYAGVSNSWKKWQGINLGIDRINAIEKKKKLQQNFKDWVAQKSSRQQKYGSLHSEFNDIYEAITPYRKARAYFIETIYNIELVRFARNFQKLVELSKKEDPDQEKINKEIEKLRKKSKNFFEDYHMPIDREITAALLKNLYQHLEFDLQPDLMQEIIKDYDSDFEAYAHELFEDSFLSSRQEVKDFLDGYKTRKHRKIEKDPVVKLSNGLFEHYRDSISPVSSQYDRKLDSLQRIYVRGLKAYQPDKRFYPDANFTLRVTYGQVKGYEPKDAVDYEYQTTLEGVMEKNRKGKRDYRIKDKLKELYEEKDYGKYANEEGSMPVCFIASNHTSGGNSGSPVLNANGHLIGINFDRNWEGTMSDLMYDPSLCRNITVDIRYVLFIMDKFAGADHLVDEMTIVE
ncbi:MAG: S46 family peptidase [Bacteroidales bacterium]|nr:S46 family peptidase [Bacteroidales bacterium]MCF8334820.1 S46 family peptidase [Bacteroidales bacterium]